MTTEALKSTVITGYDASPPTKPAGGAGGANGLQEISGSVTTTTGVTTGSTYQLVRLRSDAYVKRVILESAAMSTSASMNIGLYYSDANDGTAKANQGTALSAALFASAVSVASAVVASDVTNQSGSYTIDKRVQPLWQAAGLSSDPGGFFDVTAVAASTVTAGGLMGVSVEFTTV